MTTILQQCKQMHEFVYFCVCVCCRLVCERTRAQEIYVHVGLLHMPIAPLKQMMSFVFGKYDNLKKKNFSYPSTLG